MIKTDLPVTIVWLGVLVYKATLDLIRIRGFLQCFCMISELREKNSKSQFHRFPLWSRSCVLYEEEQKVSLDTRPFEENRSANRL